MKPDTAATLRFSSFNRWMSDWKYALWCEASVNMCSYREARAPDASNVGRSPAPTNQRSPIPTTSKSNFFCISSHASTVCEQRFATLLLYPRFGVVEPKLFRHYLTETPDYHGETPNPSVRRCPYFLSDDSRENFKVIIVSCATILFLFLDSLDFRNDKLIDRQTDWYVCG